MVAIEEKRESVCTTYSIDYYYDILRRLKDMMRRNHSLPSHKKCVETTKSYDNGRSGFIAFLFSKWSKSQIQQLMSISKSPVP